MISQLLDEPYFERNLIPKFFWKKLEKLDTWEIPTALYFWTCSYFVSFKFKDEVIECNEGLFKVMEENLVEVEKTLLEYLARSTEARCGNYGHPSPHQNLSLFYGYMVEPIKERSFIEICHFIEMPEYITDRNVSKLFLYALSEKTQEQGYY